MHLELIGPDVGLSATALETRRLYNGIYLLTSSRAFRVERSRATTNPPLQTAEEDGKQATALTRLCTVAQHIAIIRP